MNTFRVKYTPRIDIDDRISVGSPFGRIKSLPALETGQPVLGDTHTSRYYVEEKTACE